MSFAIERVSNIMESVKSLEDLRRLAICIDVMGFMAGSSLFDRFERQIGNIIDSRAKGLDENEVNNLVRVSTCGRIGKFKLPHRMMVFAYWLIRISVSQTWTSLCFQSALVLGYGNRHVDGQKKIAVVTRDRFDILHKIFKLIYSNTDKLRQHHLSVLNILSMK